MSEIPETVSRYIDETFRFGVENDQGATSLLWRFWLQGNDAYIVSRHANIKLKVSLHESGVCHIKHLSGENETVERWKRPTNPEADIYIAVSIAFPTDMILAWCGYQKMRAKEAYCTLPAAPAGYATIFHFVYVREGVGVPDPCELGVLIQALNRPSGGCICIYSQCREYPLSALHQAILGGMQASSGEADYFVTGWYGPMGSVRAEIVHAQGVQI